MKNISQVRGGVYQSWGQVRRQVENQVRVQVWDQAWGQVRRQVLDQVAEQVWDSFKKTQETP